MPTRLFMSHERHYAAKPKVTPSDTPSPPKTSQGPTTGVGWVLPVQAAGLDQGLVEWGRRHRVPPTDARPKPGRSPGVDATSASCRPSLDGR